MGGREGEGGGRTRRQFDDRGGIVLCSTGFRLHVYRIFASFASEKLKVDNTVNRLLRYEGKIKGQT